MRLLRVYFIGLEIIVVVVILIVIVIGIAIGIDSVISAVLFDRIGSLAQATYLIAKW